MAVWRFVLNFSRGFADSLDIGIEASGFEQAHTSAHSTKPTNLTIQQLKTTLLVDTRTTAFTTFA